MTSSDNDLLWKLPKIRSKETGKLGPGFGLGAGCGVGLGLGAGLFGGAALGTGIPQLQFGIGIGAGCGIGLGFGYGFGKGIAYDENKRHSNVGNLFKWKRASSSPSTAKLEFWEATAPVKASLDETVSNFVETNKVAQYHVKY